MPRQSHNKSQHNRRGTTNPETSLKPKLRSRSHGRSSQANYQFKKTQKQKDLQRLLGQYFDKKHDGANTVSIGKAKALYSKSLSAFNNKNYGRAIYMLLLSSAVLATYVPNAVPGTTGFEGKSVDETIGYLEYNYDVATNVGDYKWKNDKQVQEAINEIAEKDEKIAAQQDDKRLSLVSTKDLLFQKLKQKYDDLFYQF